MGSARASDFDVRFQATPHDAIFSIAAEGDKMLAVGALGLAIGSDDGGKSWARQETPTKLSLLSVAEAKGRALAVGQGGTILRRDNGAWQKVDGGTDSRLLAVGMGEDGLAIIAGSFGTILRSEDGGATWESVKVDWAALLTDAQEPHLYAVRMVSNAIYVTGEFGLVLKSADRGKTWKATETGEASLFDLSMDEQGQGLAVGQKGTILRTADGGATWQKMPVPADNTLLGIWRNGAQAEAVGIQAAFKSQDGGATWTVDNRGDTSTGWYEAIIGAGRPIIVGHQARVVILGD